MIKLRLVKKKKSLETTADLLSPSSTKVKNYIIVHIRETAMHYGKLFTRHLRCKWRWKSYQECTDSRSDECWTGHWDCVRSNLCLLGIDVFPISLIICWDQLDKQGFWKWYAVGEWETRHKSPVKGEAQATNTTPRWRCWNLIQAHLIILSAVKERMWRELSYSSCGLQGQKIEWSLTTN